MLITREVFGLLGETMQRLILDSDPTVAHLTLDAEVGAMVAARTKETAAKRKREAWRAEEKRIDEVCWELQTAASAIGRRN